MIIGIDASHANKPNRTGVEEYCFQIIQEFKKIIPPKVRVILYTPNVLLPELSELPKNWEVKILKWPLKKLWSQFPLAFELWKNPPNVYFSPGQLLPVFAPKNSVVIVHDSAFEAFPNAYRFWGRQYLKLMNRLIVKKASTILTSTEFNKKELLKYYGKLFLDENILKNKIKIVPLAYDKARYNLDVPLEKNIYGEYILSIGRLEEKKNTRRIVEAFDLLKNDFTDLKLVLVGSPGAGYEKVAQAIENSPNKKDIILPGYVAADKITSILKQAKVFVFPSQYEGFGIPVLEALAVGVPVVAGSIEALKEVGSDALEYAVVDSNQDIAAKIAGLLNNNDKRNQKIELGLKLVKNFSWENTAKQSLNHIL